MSEAIIVTAIIFLVFAFFGIISNKAEKSLARMNQDQQKSVGKKTH